MMRNIYSGKPLNWFFLFYYLCSLYLYLDSKTFILLMDVFGRQIIRGHNVSFSQHNVLMAIKNILANIYLSSPKIIFVSIRESYIKELQISRLFQGVISEVKLAHLDDDTERYSRIKTLNYASYTQLVRMVKILRCRRPEALAKPHYYNVYSVVCLLNYISAWVEWLRQFRFNT